MLTIVMMGHPADQGVVVLTTAPVERVEELLREFRDAHGAQGWHEELVQDFLSSRLPRVEVRCVTVRGYSADEWDVKTEDWS